MNKKNIGIFVVGSLAVAALYYSGLQDYISLAGLKANSHHFKAMVDRNYWFSVAMFVVSYMATVAASLPVVAPFTLLGGFLFDTIPGALYSALASAFGSVIYVFCLRHFLRASIEQRFEKQLVRFKENMKVYGKSYVLILHFMTIIPFFVINGLVALSDLSLLDVFWTTMVGSGPIFLLFAFEGRQLATIESVHDILSPSFMLALGLLVLLACMPIIIRRIRGSMEV